MAKPKVYLSAAAHQYDNPTKCPVKCGENVHCKAYMDIVEKRLGECGIDVRRGYRDEVGSPAMEHRVADANKWKADLYYVAHTNATGEKDAKVHRSITMCWYDDASKKKAAVIGKYRKSIATHKVVVNTSLYEIKKTSMTCLYDELFFHDNPDDCKWFHNGGMEIMAEETVQAICELVNVKYVPAVDEVAELKKQNDALRKENAALKSNVDLLNEKIESAKKALQ